MMGQTNPHVWFVLCCRECDDACGGKPTPMPFASAEDRGRWAAEHTRSTGHDRWLVMDQPKYDRLIDIP